MLRVEDVGHNYKIAPTAFLTALIFLYKFVKSEEFCNERIGIMVQVLVVTLENRPQKFILTVMNSFKHVFAVGGIVEE